MDLGSLEATNIILMIGIIMIVVILQRGFDILSKQQETVIYNLNCLRLDNRAMKDALDSEGGKPNK
tara:strand:+ start:35334 stop:35531 length:198 start_codon:yes stop_codon:yes gene_type:complete